MPRFLSGREFECARMGQDAQLFIVFRAPAADLITATMQQRKKRANPGLPGLHVACNATNWSLERTSAETDNGTEGWLSSGHCRIRELRATLAVFGHFALPSSRQL